MKAYKVFNNDWTCRKFKYEIGETYTFDGKLKLCPSYEEIKDGYGGFHACKSLHSCFRYYACVPWNKLAEVELLGEVKGQEGDKQVTNKIKILKEIPFEKIGEVIKDDLSKAANESYGVNESSGISGSRGVNESHGVNASAGINESAGVAMSRGVHGSCGVRGSRGVNESYGATASAGVNGSRGVNESCGVNASRGVDRSRGVNESHGVDLSRGVHGSRGVNESCGVNSSHGIHVAYGVHVSRGVNESQGVNGSRGVNASCGVNGSSGVNASYGVLNSYGICHGLFVDNQKNHYILFNKRIEKNRWQEIFATLQHKLNDWTPVFNNLKFLYLKAGSEWEKTPIPNAERISKKEAWADMPKEAIDYLKSLPEFNQKIFTAVTGIE